MISARLSRVSRSKEKALAVYNHLSGWYDWLAASSEQHLANIGLQKLNIHNGEMILEIGCGTGSSVLEMANAISGRGQIHGLDISCGMIEVAKRKVSRAKLAGRAVFEQGDGACLPFISKNFDIVFMSFVLELFDTPEIPLVLAECRRVLKPGGRICVVGMSRVKGETLLVRVYEWFHEHIPAYVDCRPIYIAQALQQAGFSILDTKYRQMWGLPVEICLARS